MKNLLSINWLLFGAAWFTLNGILHDVFVLRAHKGAYDRDLLRLLMDGHVLILSGLLLALCWQMLRTGQTYGAVAGVVLGLGMIVYCLMIFPFLKSFGTLFVSVMLVIVCAYAWMSTPHRVA